MLRLKLKTVKGRYYEGWLEYQKHLSSWMNLSIKTKQNFLKNLNEKKEQNIFEGK